MSIRGTWFLENNFLLKLRSIIDTLMFGTLFTVANFVFDRNVRYTSKPFRTRELRGGVDEFPWGRKS